MRYVIIALLWAAPLAAQQSQPIGYKDPQLATILGVILTGGGQFYAGRPAKGALLLGGSAAAILFAAQESKPSICTGQCSNSDAMVLGVGAAIMLWGYGWLTASKDAQLHNEALRVSIAPGRIGLTASIRVR